MITLANKYIEKFVQNQLFGNSYQNIHAMTGNPINVNNSTGYITFIHT